MTDNTEQSAGPTENCMLVSLTVRKWGIRRHDSSATASVVRDTGAERKRVSASKMLIPGEYMAEINAAETALRNHYKEETLPWSNDGTRILPSANYFPFMRKADQLIRVYEDKADVFAAGYAGLRVQDKELGTLYNPREYPHPDDMRAKFSARIKIYPVPLGRDFRLDISATEEERLREKITEDTMYALAEAQTSLWWRIHDTVETLVGKLKAREVDEDGNIIKQGFRNSVLDELKGLTELLPRLNIAGDVKLDAMAERLKAACAWDPEVLKENTIVRQSTITMGEQILGDLAWLAGTSPEEKDEAA